MDRTNPRNPEERFVSLFVQNERNLRVFVRSMGLDWTAVDDVIQTISLVMWRKWDEFEGSSDQDDDEGRQFLRWARVIGRFEVLKFRRKMARDRHVFGENLMELMAKASQELDEQFPLERYREALGFCLQSLPPASRELISVAYRGDRTIREIAESSGKSAKTLYRMLDRLREKLQACIESRIQNNERLAL